MKNPLTKDIVNKIENQQQENNKTIISMITTDNIIIETVHNRTTRETSFVLFKNGDITYKKKVEVNGIFYKPVSTEEDILKYNLVLLPSEAVEYEDTQSLVKEIQFFIHKYLEISEEYEMFASYYVLFTWIYDKFNELPYLRALGDFGVGKSRFLQAIGSLCYKPIFVSGATTTSPIFRMVERISGTLILDEADFKFSDTTQDIIKILNNGFQRGFPVIRSEGKDFTPRAFDVFCPKLIATRNYFSDRALESRCITEVLRKKTRSDIPCNKPKIFESESLTLRNKLLMFRFKNFNKEICFDEEDLNIEPRLNQIMLPLLSIVEDINAKKELKKYFTEFNKNLINDRNESWEGYVLRALIEMQNEESEPTVKQVSDKFNKLFMDEFEKSITPKKTGYYLSKKLNLKTSKTNKGFIVLMSNKKTIENLRKVYGIQDEQSERENIMNIDIHSNKTIEIFN